MSKQLGFSRTGIWTQLAAPCITVNMFTSPIFMIFISLLVVSIQAFPLSSSSDTEPWILYVALQSKGILTVSFDPSKSSSMSLQIIDVNTDGGVMPGWLTTHNDKIYSVSRTDYPANSSVNGGVFAFQKHYAQEGQRAAAGSNYSLGLLSSADTGGKGGVACDVSRDGRTISVASIDGSAVSVHPLSETGLIGEASYLFKYNLTQPGPGMNNSQVQSNPHEAIFEPSGQFMFVPDRGADRLYAYYVAGPFSVSQVLNVTLPPGTGPRHITFRTFNCTRTYMYLVSELDNTVRVFTLDGVSNLIDDTPATGTPKLEITLQQMISTLGLGVNRTAPDNHHLAAEIALSNDGKFAYVSNRDTTTYATDTLTIFSVNPNPSIDDAHLTYLGQNATYGKIPRHFSLSPDPQTQYAAVANEVSQSLLILERGQSGLMGAVRGNLSLGSLDVTQNLGPTAVIWG